MQNGRTRTVAGFARFSSISSYEYSPELVTKNTHRTNEISEPRKKRRNSKKYIYTPDTRRSNRTRSVYPDHPHRCTEISRITSRMHRLSSFCETVRDADWIRLHSRCTDRVCWCNKIAFCIPDAKPYVATLIISFARDWRLPRTGVGKVVDGVQLHVHVGCVLLVCNAN